MGTMLFLVQEEDIFQIVIQNPAPARTGTGGRTVRRALRREDAKENKVCL